MGHMIYNILVEKPERKIPLGKPRGRWEENIRMDLIYMRWESVNWIHLTLVRVPWRSLVNTVLNLRVP
jgi:hypothetical protein